MCGAFDVAPHVPIAGTSAVSMFNEKAQVGRLFLDDLIFAHVMGVFSDFSLLLPVQSESPREVWDVFCRGRLGTFGPPKCIQTGEGGEWKNQIWTDLCAERRIKLQFQGVGAHPWLSERRNGIARGIRNLFFGDDRFMN